MVGIINPGPDGGGTSQKPDMPDATADADSVRSDTTTGGETVNQKAEKPQYHKNLSGFPEQEQPDSPRRTHRWTRQWGDFYRYRQMHGTHGMDIEGEEKSDNGLTQNDSQTSEGESHHPYRENKRWGDFYRYRQMYGPRDMAEGTEHHDGFVQNSQASEGDKPNSETKGPVKSEGFDNRRRHGYRRFYRGNMPGSSEQEMTEGGNADSMPPFPFDPEKVRPGDHPANHPFLFHHPMHHHHFHCGRFQRPKLSLHETIMQEFDFIHN